MSSDSFEKKRVLIISDKPRVLAEIEMGLMGYFDISIAAAGNMALSILETNKTAAVVIYIGENREKAFSALADISELVKKKCIPVVFLAKNDDEDDETAAFEAGADDYAVKRSNGFKALIDRINLRARAGENDSFPRAVTPESVLANKTILIAEDVSLNRMIVADMFSDIEGLTLEFAGDGKEAVEKFAKTPELFSLIFMDIQMPEMNGLEATKAIRSLKCKNARCVPIIALTSDTDEEDKTLFFEAGMDGFIEKPIAYDKLLNKAAEHCLR